MVFDRVIRNGLIFTDGALRPLDLAFIGQRIAALGVPGTLDGARIDDAGGKWVLPGFIDAHFHVRAPASPDREDFASATAAAAAGGVTTILEMPISTPPAVNADVLRRRRAAIEQDAYIDVGLYVGSASAETRILGDAVEAGAIAFKAFLQPVPPGREADLTGICIEGNATLLQVLRAVKPFGLPAVFHPEDEPTYRLLTAELQQAGRVDGPAHAAARPDYVEAIAVGTLLTLAEALAVRVHIPHVTSALTVDLIRAAKRRGAPVTAETCSHYLAFDQRALAEFGPFAVCNPPFKSARDQAALWAGLNDATIDIVTSDHAPFLAAEKQAAAGNIWASPPGIPGGQMLGPYVMGAAVDGRISLLRAVEALSRRPAEIFGLSATKGSLRPGADADVVIYDPSQPSTVDIAHWHSKSRASGVVWHGHKLPGTVVATYSRGALIVAGGQLVGERGHGQLVIPSRPSTG